MSIAEAVSGAGGSLIQLLRQPRVVPFSGTSFAAADADPGTILNAADLGALEALVLSTLWSSLFQGLLPCSSMDPGSSLAVADADPCTTLNTADDDQVTTLTGADADPGTSFAVADVDTGTSLNVADLCAHGLSQAEGRTLLAVRMLGSRLGAGFHTRCGHTLGGVDACRCSRTTPTLWTV